MSTSFQTSQITTKFSVFCITATKFELWTYLEHCTFVLSPGAPSRNKFLSLPKILKSLRKKSLGLHETFVFLKSGSFGLHETIPNLLNHASNPLRDTRGYHVTKADWPVRDSRKTTWQVTCDMCILCVLGSTTFGLQGLVLEVAEPDDVQDIEEDVRFHRSSTATTWGLNTPTIWSEA